MIYSENIFVCLAAPLIIAVLLLKGEARRFTGFFILGLLSCLLSAYISSFLAAMAAGLKYGSMTAAEAAIKLTPVCEEIMKALPVFFYMAVFAPKKEAIIPSALAVGLGFATMENCCYLTQYGSAEFLFVLIRGFSAGVMHAVCAAILGYGLAFIHSRKYLTYTGAFAIICITSTFHAIYNLFVSAADARQIVGYVLPTAAGVVMLLLIGREKDAAETE